MNHFSFLLLHHLIILVNLAAINKHCPNENFCKCNWDWRRIECFCRNDECRNALSINSPFSDEEKTPYKFSNKSFKQFKEIFINEVEILDNDYFKNALFSNDIKLSIQFANILGANFLANLTWINNLEIIYSNLALVEPNAFNYLKCDTFLFLSLGDNYALDIKSFGNETFIENLILDYHSSNNLKNLFVSNSPGWISLKKQIQMINFVNYSLTKQQLNRYWSSEATIKKIHIQEAKGIKILDHTFVPKFSGLEKIEIYFTDIDQISPNFALLHSNNLKYLTIRQSNLEIVQSEIFGKLTKLEYLDLSSNPIKLFELKAFKDTLSLKTLMLHSISEHYRIDNSDICMLSYLPCGVNVYLDTYADFLKSCSQIFLNEIRNESNRFDFSRRTSELIDYKNAQRDCGLKKALTTCLAKTSRNNHCLLDRPDFKNENKDFLIDSNQDNILSINELVTDPTSSISIKQTTEPVKLSTNNISDTHIDLVILDTSKDEKGSKNEWLVFIICILVLFCIIQFFVGILLIYLYCNRSNSVGCLKETDSAPKPISLRRNDESEKENSDEKENNELKLKRVVFTRPKFTPRPPIQFLRDPSTSYRY